jgi:hypothetical protein
MIGGGSAVFPTTPPRLAEGTRAKAAERAAFVYDYLTGRTNEEAARAKLGDFFVPFSAFRARFIDCRDTASPDVWWDTVELVAWYVDVFMSPKAAAEVWSEVRGSRCYAAMPEHAKKWFEVLDALGRRDSAATARLALEALQQGAGDKELAWFYGARMTALLAAGRRGEALETYKQFHHRLREEDRSKVWFEWFESAVSDPLAQGAR